MQVATRWVWVGGALLALSAIGGLALRRARLREAQLQLAELQLPFSPLDAPDPEPWTGPAPPAWRVDRAAALVR
jgi:hypothetical protein